MPSFSGIEVIVTTSSGPVLVTRLAPNDRPRPREGFGSPPRPESPNPSAPSPESRNPVSLGPATGYSPQLGGSLLTGGGPERTDALSRSDEVVKALVVRGGSVAEVEAESPFG